MAFDKAARILILAGLPVLAAAAPMGDRRPVDEIAKVESDFAAAFQERAWTSFVETAADDSVFPDPPNGFPSGKEVFADIAKRAGNSRRTMLDWWPSHVEVACANDLAWSTGPTVRKDPRGTWYSHYVTVWARQPDGAWRWVYDRGNPHVDMGKHPRGAAPETISRAYCAKAKPVAVEQTRASLLAADRELLEAAKGDARATYRRRLADVTRLHRFGQSPIIGKPAVLTALATDHPVLSFEPVGSRVSATGDLGVTYGNMTWREKDRGEQKGSYLHIWRRKGSHWELALDQITPAVPPSQLAPA